MDWQTIAVWLIFGAVFIALAGRGLSRRLGGRKRGR
jgi:hypothetical protein